MMFLPFASFSDSRPSAGKLSELERPASLGFHERGAEKALRAKMKHLIAECNGLFGKVVADLIAEGQGDSAHGFGVEDAVPRAGPLAARMTRVSKSRPWASLPKS
jgi:hypothetical protein